MEMLRRLDVLLLEDDANDAQLLESRLVDGGFSVSLERVTSGPAFEAALSRRAWDIIFADYNVPSYDGVQALLAARTARPDVPLLFVTGAIGEERAVDLLKLGATDYILKDRPERLVSSVHRALGEADGRRERRRVEQDLQRRAEFDKQLAAIVSHDLRNPLNVILLSTQLAMENGNLAPELARLLVRIHTAGERASRLVRDLLDFTQARQGGGLPIERRRVNVLDVLDRAIEDAEATHPGRKIVLRQEGEHVGDYDPDRIMQVAQNLLTNALRYSPPDSVIHVELFGGPKTFQLAVHNDGDPIPAELQRRLFQPLQRGDSSANRAARSVGLGLFIVAEIVRGHGGTVIVSSKAGAGTEFRVELPRFVDPPTEKER